MNNNLMQQCFSVKCPVGVRLFSLENNLTPTEQENSRTVEQVKRQRIASRALSPDPHGFSPELSWLIVDPCELSRAEIGSLRW